MSQSGNESKNPDRGRAETSLCRADWKDEIQGKAHEPTVCVRSAHLQSESDRLGTACVFTPRRKTKNNVSGYYVHTILYTRVRLKSQTHPIDNFFFFTHKMINENETGV